MVSDPMMMLPVPIARPDVRLPAPIALDLVAAILATLNAQTARTYQADYRDFARFLGLADPAAALEALIGMGPGVANACALSYRVHLADRGLAAGTIARRLVALRSACKAARRIGRISWGLDVPGPKPSPYRDTRGPGRAGWRRMLAMAKDRVAGDAATPKTLRDLAIVRMLHDLALRRGELVGLDTADVDLASATVAVIGKGQTEPVRLTLPGPTREALAAWMRVRGDRPGAVFVPLDPGADPATRLTGEAVRRIVGALSRRAGLTRTIRPHGLRHESITAALDSGRDVRDVRKFSRHAKLETVLIYDDNRTDVAGDIARAVAEDD